MNRKRLALMGQMLVEVISGKWKGGPQVAEWNKEHSFKPNKQVLFDIGDWVSSNSFGPANACGTTACAVGHACLDQRFNEMGLHIEIGEAKPIFKNKENWDAVEKFFGIENETAEMLFMDYHYDTTDVTPAQVLERVVLLLQLGERKFRETIGD